MMNLADDVDVICRDALDGQSAAQFSKPWLVQDIDGAIKEFDTEEEACAFQRAHRDSANLGGSRAMNNAQMGQAI